MNSQDFQVKALQAKDAYAPTMQTLCLTADQMSDLFIADDSSALGLASRQRHLRECSRCRAEFAQLKLALNGLRQSAQLGADAAYHAIAPSMRMQRAARDAGRPIMPVKSHRGTWAMAVATLIVLVTIPFASHRAKPDAQATNGASAKSVPANGAVMTDEALMDGISQDLSVSVPSSLQPLADPATSDGGSSVSDDNTTMR